MNNFIIDKSLTIQSPLESIDGVWKFTRLANKRDKTISLPGHLFHFIKSGSYKLKTNSREYNIEAGDLIYYHGTENVEWIGNNSVVIFYSIGFTAKKLQPYSLNNRVLKANDKIEKTFKKIYKLFSMPGSNEKRFILFAEMNRLLGEVEKLNKKVEPISDSANIWWEIEKYFYTNQDFRPAIDNMCELGKCSRSTLVRKCKTATGKAPLSRMQELRMREAEALLKNSTLNVTQVAEYLGYPRIHEFSREFSQYFSYPPTQC